VRDDVINPTRESQLGRRNLVRAGATAAWAVPVIALASPASADPVCSGGSASLTAVVLANTQTQSGHPKLTVTVQVQVCNTGSTATCGLYATASMSEASARFNAFSVGDWPGVSLSGAGSQNLMVSAPAGEQIAAGQCATYLVSYAIHDGSGDHTATISFQTPNGGLGSVTVKTSS
jgi:hypothetical protein